MFQGITKTIMGENTTEQLEGTLDGLVGAISFRSAQGIGTDEALSEMIAEIVSEMNTRKIDD
jgi:hypothetical protein